MPIYKTKKLGQTHIKIYRPNGMRYANGPTLPKAEDSMAQALGKFYLEFGELPQQEHTHFEVIGVTGGWAATIMEIKDVPSAFEVREES